MLVKRIAVLGAALLSLALGKAVLAQDASGHYVRIAELEVDPDQLGAFKAAIREGIETAVRVEPGVLALYAVSDHEDASRIRVFEVYVSAEAYRTHLETPHFRKFRETTDKMVKSRKLSDAVPIALRAKPQ